jgi:hypothetical protein
LKLATSSPARKNYKKSLCNFTQGGPYTFEMVVEKIQDGPAEPASYVLFASAKGTTGSAANVE